MEYKGSIRKSRNTPSGYKEINAEALHIIKTESCISPKQRFAYHQLRKKLYIIVAKAVFDTHLKV